MPIIEGADLSNVSSNNTVPAGTYRFRVKKSEYIGDNNENLIIISEILEAPEEALVGKDYRDLINRVQKDGKTNEFFLQNIKRYMEACFGKGSPQAVASSPDTDWLNDQEFIAEVTMKPDKEGTDRNRFKKMLHV